jgi:rhodanese-related sulfurtransferase
MGGESLQTISPETLRDWLASPDLVIIDLRNAAQWEASNVKIGRARHFEPGREVSEWAGDLPQGKKLVLY